MKGGLRLSLGSPLACGVLPCTVGPITRVRKARDFVGTGHMCLEHLQSFVRCPRIPKRKITRMLVSEPRNLLLHLLLEVCIKPCALGKRG